MGCIYCEGVTNKYRMGDPERQPLVDTDINIDIPCRFYGKSRMSMFMDKKYIYLNLNNDHILGGWSMRAKAFEWNYCPICGRPNPNRNGGNEDDIE